MDIRSIVLGVFALSFCVLFLNKKCENEKNLEIFEKKFAIEKSNYGKEIAAMKELVEKANKEKKEIAKEVDSKKKELKDDFKEKLESAEYYKNLNDENRKYHYEKLNELKTVQKKAFAGFLDKCKEAFVSKDYRMAYEYLEAAAIMHPEEENVLKLRAGLQRFLIKTPLKMNFIYLEKGNYRRGSFPSEKFRGLDEEYHDVELTKGFFLMDTEVTQEQWDAVMNSKDMLIREENKITTPSETKGPLLPVENVSYNEVQSFISKLNSLNQGRYRLPTEAEWEYACRAGEEKDPYAGFGAPDGLAWYSKNSGRTPQVIKTKVPNAFGLYDMSGNVSEWVNDYYGDYVKGKAIDPQGPDSGNQRVYPGGSFKDSEAGCRAAKRNRAAPNFKSGFLGFRLVLEPKDG